MRICASIDLHFLVVVAVPAVIIVATLFEKDIAPVSIQYVIISSIAVSLFCLAFSSLLLLPFEDGLVSVLSYIFANFVAGTILSFVIIVPASISLLS